MKLNVQKRIASDIIGCGKKQVYFDPERLDEIKESITKADIRRMILDNAIRKVEKSGPSRVRANKRRTQKSKGLQKGKGSRKGKNTSRAPAKKTWMNKIRAQRSFLKVLKEKKHITNETYKELAGKAKGGFFRSRRHISLYVATNKDHLAAHQEHPKKQEQASKEPKKRLKRQEAKRDEE